MPRSGFAYYAETTVQYVDKLFLAFTQYILCISVGSVLKNVIEKVRRGLTFADESTDEDLEITENQEGMLGKHNLTNLVNTSLVVCS